MGWRRTLPAVFSAFIERLLDPSERQQSMDVRCCGTWRERHLRIPPFAKEREGWGTRSTGDGIEPKAI